MYPRSRAINLNIHNLTRHPRLRIRTPRFPLGSPVRQPLSNIEDEENHEAYPNSSRNQARARDLLLHRGLLDQLAHVRLMKAHTYVMFARNDMRSRRAFGDITGRYTNPCYVVIAVYSNGVAPTYIRSIFRRSTLRSTPPCTWLREPVTCSKDLTIPSQSTSPP